jgi:hypothetical protein
MKRYAGFKNYSSSLLEEQATQLNSMVTLNIVTALKMKSSIKRNAIRRRMNILAHSVKLKRKANTYFRMELYIMDNGRVIKGMVMGYRSGLTGLSTKAFGLITKLMEKALSIMLMEMCSKVNGSLTRLMGMESICMLMEQDTKGIGRTIYKTAMELKLGLMDRSMRDIMFRVRSKDMEPTHGLMVLLMKENGFRIRSMGG